MEPLIVLLLALDVTTMLPTPGYNQLEQAQTASATLSYLYWAGIVILEF
jgi:hypothetical protein